MSLKAKNQALKLAASYVVVALSWILFSDQAVKHLIHDSNLRMNISMFKGFGFVLLTGALLYIILCRLLTGWAGEAEKRAGAEMAQGRAADQYRQLFALSRDAITIRDVKSANYIAANPAAVRLFGMADEAEFLSKKPDHLSPEFQPDGRASVEKATDAIQTAMREGSHLFEWTHRRNDGEEFSAEVLLTRMDQEGNPAVLATIRDVTKRKEASRALEESETRFRTFIEKAPIAIAVARETVILYSNPACARMFGFEDPRQIIGQNIGTFCSPESRPMIEEYHRQRMQGLEGHLAYEAVGKRKDGSGFPAHLLVDRIDLPDGPGSMAFITDLTSARESEAERRKLSQAVEQSPVSIVITNADGEVEYVNAKFTRLTGYSLDEIRGKNPRFLKGNLTSQEEYKRLWQSITCGHHWRGEFHNRKKNGEFFWENAFISPIVDGTGRITHYLAVKEDITERKALEAQLQHAQKLKSIGQLAGGVAHDFNNIIAAMMLHLGLIQENPNLDDETRQSIRELLNESQRAANLTRQLLMFSRQSVLDVKTLDMKEVVSNMLKMLGRLLGEHIRIEFFPSEIICQVEADSGMIGQVLLNLCVNARDAMPSGGRLTIRIEPVQIDPDLGRRHPESRPGSFVCLTVADTGCGMDDATLQRIFEPFFTTKDVGNGTGLGLATVYGIVGQHRGWVDVESHVGEGTTFYVFLPAVSRTSYEPSSPIGSQVRRGRETILLAEDEASVRKVTFQTLQSLGYNVLEAANGEEALKVWGKHHGQIDLLLSDMMMPGGVTGLNLARKLRESKPGLKVLIFSGYSAEMVAGGFPTGENIHRLQKPFQVEMLSDSVRKCLDATTAVPAR